MIVNCYFVYCADMRTASVLGWKTWRWNRIFLAAATNVIVTQYYSLFSTVSRFLHPYTVASIVYAVIGSITSFTCCGVAQRRQSKYIGYFFSILDLKMAICGAFLVQFFAVQLKLWGGEKILSPRYIFLLGVGAIAPPPLAPGIDVTGVADA